MNAEFIPPLSVQFIWHPSDAGTVYPILDEIKKCFARDKDRPFSRGLNIPLFFYSSQNPNEIPDSHPKGVAARNVVFVFTSVNTAGQPNWTGYIESLVVSDVMYIVPVAIDRFGLGHGGSLRGLNCVRSYDWPGENEELHAIVTLAHEIYRYGFVNIKPDYAGKNSSITVFLSHAKAGDTGHLHAEAIRRFIDNTNMNRFFDATEISPGFPFDEEIERYIPGSTLLAIESDAYSSRYWCQREILSAKHHNRPIVVVDCLDEYEDRIFPAASNVPCVHVPSDVPLSERNILRILVAAILETIRHNHAIKSLELYQSQGWVGVDCELTPRPPEIRQVLSIKEHGKNKICYPEPPIYSDEADWHRQLAVDTFTPLWSLSDRDILKCMRVGISISDVSSGGFSKNHLDADQLVRLAQDLARHLLARSAMLLYGGDLRPDGFTAFILDEAAILKERLRGDQPHVENHLSWPLYVSSPEIVAWRAKYHQVMETREYAIPDDVASGLSNDTFLPPNTANNKYIWSRCLTDMRKNSISTSTGRVCAGGRLSDYKGKMPGVLEEILITLDMHKPIYLLGAFGGVVGQVCQVILDGMVTDPLTENWQISHNVGYADLQKLARTQGQESDYQGIKDTLESIQLARLATEAGLEEDEYKRLMRSPFVDECVHLILKGLKQLAGGQPGGVA